MNRVIPGVLLVVAAACVMGPPRTLPRGEVADPIAEGRLVGVTTVDGDTVMFDVPSPSDVRAGTATVDPPRIVGDAIVATVEGAPTRVPVDQVAEYWYRDVSRARTVAIASTAAAAALILALMISFAGGGVF